MNPSSGFAYKSSLSMSFEGRKDAKDKQKDDQKSYATQQKQHQQRQQQQQQQEQKQEQKQQQQQQQLLIQLIQQQQQQQQQKQQQKEQQQKQKQQQQQQERQQQQIQQQKQQQQRQQQRQQQQQEPRQQLQQQQQQKKQKQQQRQQQQRQQQQKQQQKQQQQKPDMNLFIPRYFAKYKSIPDPFKQYTDPLILSWDMKPLPRGEFPVFAALIFKLRNRDDSPKFQLKNSSTFTPHNCIAGLFCTDFGEVLLYDGIYWIAICSTDPSKRCCVLREAVHTAIREVVSIFDYMAEFKNLKEYFYCKICCNKSLGHFCRLNDDQKTVTCCDSHTTACINKSHQLPWFSAGGEFVAV